MKMAPALRMRSKNASASSSASSTCSAAMRSTSGTAASKLADDDDRAEIAPAGTRRLGRAAAISSWRSTAASTASPNLASSVIRIDCAAASCSACASRSAAIQSGSLPRVGDDQHFRRAGDHVDADGAEHLALGGGDIGIARPDDLGDRPDRLGAVGKRGDRLRAADPVDLRHAGDVGGDQHQRVDLALRRRNGDHHPLDAGDLGRHRVHQHRARIARRAARHVEPDRLDRRPARAELDADRVDIAVVGRALPLVMRLDALARETQRLDAVACRPCHRRPRYRRATRQGRPPPGRTRRISGNIRQAPRRPRRAPWR